MTKSRSLVEIVCPSSRPCSPPTRETLRLARLSTIICCTISSSSASRKLRRRQPPAHTRNTHGAPREFRRVERRVQLQEAAQRRHRRLRAHVREERASMARGRLCRRRLRVRRERLAVVVRRRVRGDELRGRVQEELLERLERLVAPACGQQARARDGGQTCPRDILPSCSP
jgi:hypothetical protein